MSAAAPLAQSNSAGPIELQAEIKRIAKSRNAVILAHNYERPEVQDVADFVGDSLGLSREAAKTSAEVIVFCGVHFMAGDGGDSLTRENGLAARSGRRLFAGVDDRRRRAEGMEGGASGCGRRRVRQHDR
jgi:hypothetical protein